MIGEKKKREPSKDRTRSFETYQCRLLFKGLGLGQSAQDLLTGFPTAVGGQHVDALVSFEHVSGRPDLSGRLQAGMS